MFNRKLDILATSETKMKGRAHKQELKKRGTHTAYDLKSGRGSYWSQITEHKFKSNSCVNKNEGGMGKSSDC